MGHMNVCFYVARATEALAALALEFGLGPRFVRAERAYLAATEMHMRFLGEVRPGTPFVFHGGVLEPGDRPRLYLEMRDIAADRVAATFTLVAAMIECATAHWRPVPALRNFDKMIGLP